MNKHPVWTYSILLVALMALVAFALLQGATTVSLSHLAGQQFNTLFNIRLPRIIAALVSGAMLAVAGAFFQAALRNAIADPSILGIAAGANLFQLLGGLLLPALLFNKFIFALLGGLVAFLLLLQFQKQMDPYRLILIGVALNAMFVGIQQIFTPTTGSSTTTTFATSTWTTTLFLVILGIIGLMLALLLAPWANYLKIGDAQLKTLGVGVTWVRLILLLLAVYLTSTVTASVGVLPFIGIIVPHISRYFVGHDYRQVVPFSVLAGAFLLLLSDTIGRLIVIPNEITAATILAVIGGPFLIFILVRQGRATTRHI
ncbi:FecCD family ABC transporter permease [Loigolactobacillus coryniformis]|uniref:FecCD family ABC transporter permease n=1 Tax=Loigolactobacillus coryniformis TaxID=1610 RepID=UPI001C600875|nr:iron ABC transporter permease [Loigolactobacillus coryniformis]MBW4803187.1 iron ABC transporter permease [Loigolactobacillus coryniformis subsp. torquens]MBW4805882.1 iron ABC transporter permease [Loigolactobacillus coryniformis subsp. torquens]